MAIIFNRFLLLLFFEALLAKESDVATIVLYDFLLDCIFKSAKEAFKI